MKQILLIMLGLVNSLFVWAGQKYVSTTGNNTNPGTFSLPFRTIQFAVNTALPGDTILVRGGIYNEKIICSVSGTALQKIRLQNYIGEEVIIDGTAQAGEAILLLNNCNHLIVDGFILQNNYMQDARGIHVKEEGSFIVIINCKVRNIGWTSNFNADPYSVNPTGQAHGILVNGRTVNGIRNIAITNCSLSQLITGNSEALTITGNVDSFALAFDSVYATRNIGIVAAGNYSWAVNPGVPASLNKARHGGIGRCVVFNNRRINNIDAPAGIYTDGADSVYILNNLVYENGNGISVGCENVGAVSNTIVVANNVIARNDNGGIVFGSNNGLVKNSQVLGNTIYKDGTAALFNAGIILQNLDSSLVANNVIIPLSNSHYGVSIFGYTATNLGVDNNLIYRYTGNQVNLYNQSPLQFVPTNALNADPLFVDTSLLLLTLTRYSPAVNAGNNIWPVVFDRDAADSFRIVNGQIDVGAFERQDGGCPAILTVDNNMKLTGKFIASQKIQFNYSPIPITQSELLFQAPVFEVLQSLEIGKLFRVVQTGCNN